MSNCWHKGVVWVYERWRKKNTDPDRQTYTLSVSFVILSDARLATYTPESMRDQIQHHSKEHQKHHNSLLRDSSWKILNQIFSRVFICVAIKWTYNCIYYYKNYSWHSITPQGYSENKIDEIKIKMCVTLIPIYMRT
jgi:hypothetical protein